MANLYPRQKAPEPRTLSIDPPKYTVPDVTLMFDSDDSLIWKPGENARPVNSKILEDQNTIRNNNIKNKENYLIPLTKSKGDIQTVSAVKYPYSSNIPISAPMYSPILSKDVNGSQFDSVNKVYYPELYCSPKQSRSEYSDNIRLNSNLKVLSNNKFKETALSTLENVQSKGVEKGTEIDNIEVTPQKQISCDSCKKNENISNEKLKSMSATSEFNLCNAMNEHSCEIQSQYILKIIEGQNQQILYLQAVLEKLLNQSNNIQHNHKNDEYHCKHCTCKLNNRESKKKIAITQTSILDSNTKSVATNTDISWKDLLSPAADKNSNYSKKNLKFEHQSREKYDPHIHKFSKDRVQQAIYNNDTSHQQSCRKDNDFTLKNVVMETVYDPPSPEPSLHINIPEFQDNQCPFSPGKNDIQENIYEEDKIDLPLVGESAILYNERLKHNDNNMARFGKEETSHEERNGVTFYNKVMINVQQVLHRYGRSDEEEDNHHQEIEEHGNYSDTTASQIAAGRIFPKNYAPTKQQLQQFGISFLDPLTLTNKHRALPSMDTFYMMGNEFKENIPSHLEIMDISRKRREAVVPHFVTDSHLAFIAQKSPGMVFDAPRNRRKMELLKEKSSNAMHKTENEFSFATKQFLDKYALKN